MTAPLYLFPQSQASLARLRLRGVVREDASDWPRASEWARFNAMHLMADEQYERMDRIERGMTP